MDLSIPGEPYHPLKVLGKAQECLEQAMSALVDYLFGFAVKMYNQSLVESKRFDHIILVHGGKSFTEYVEKLHRPDSFDWDIKILVAEDANIDISELSRSVFQQLALYMNVKLGFIPMAKVTLYKALSSCSKLDGFNIQAGKITPFLFRENNVKVEAGRRRPAGSATGVIDYLCLVSTVIDMKRYNVLSLGETWPTRVSPVMLTNCFKAVTECEKMYRQLLDKKRYYISLNSLIEELKRIVKPDDPYRKKDKAAKRLEILQQAMVSSTEYPNGFLTADARTFPDTCFQNIIFDATDSHPEFKKEKRVDFIADFHKTRDTQYIQSHPDELNYIRLYTRIIDPYYRKINSVLLNSYFRQKSIDESIKYLNLSNKTDEINKTIQFLDQCFDGLNKLPAIDYTQNPLVLFRLSGFIELATQDTNRPENLYGLKVGTIVDNVTYVSTSWTNIRRASAFNEDSQFKGVIFKITASSSRGLMVVDDVSEAKGEKEVILDRRGKLKITNVSFKYVIEQCNNMENQYRYTERMFIEADYLPPENITGGNDKKPSHLFTDVKPVAFNPTMTYHTMYEDSINSSEAEKMHNLGFVIFEHDSPIRVLKDINNMINGSIDEHMTELLPYTTVINTIIGPIRILTKSPQLEQVQQKEIPIKSVLPSKPFSSKESSRRIEHPIVPIRPTRGIIHGRGIYNEINTSWLMYALIIVIILIIIKVISPPNSQQLNTNLHNI